jgi:hypothetical protein
MYIANIISSIYGIDINIFASWNIIIQLLCFSIVRLVWFTDVLKPQVT